MPYANIEDKKACDKRYRQTEHGKEIKRISDQRFWQTERGKEVKKRYRQSKHGKEVIKIYSQSENYKQMRALSQQRVKIDLINILGSRCKICGYDDDIRGLEIDHINGGGSSEKRRFGSGISMYRYYRRNTEEAKIKLQILCGTCHNIKTFQESLKYIGHANTNR